MLKGNISNRSCSLSPSTVGPLPATSSSGEFLAIGTLVGQHIFNSSRDILGTVIELIIDLKSNKLQYIVLATRPRFGVGKKLVAVPWKAFAIAEDKSGLILDIGLEQISNAPGFAKNDWPDMTHPYWTLQINSHYGLKTR